MKQNGNAHSSKRGDLMLPIGLRKDFASHTYLCLSNDKSGDTFYNIQKIIRRFVGSWPGWVLVA